MTGADGVRMASAGGALLERALSYTLGTVHRVTPHTLSWPTPCSEWDLRALLNHINDSLDTLQEAVESGCIELHQPNACGDLPADLVTAFRCRARRLLGAWTAAAERDRIIAIGGLPLVASIVAGAGAIEIAVHGWDISRACGQRRPIPSTLAAEMLEISSLIVTGSSRRPLFAAPVAVSPLAGPSDRLIAFLGRDPG